MKTIRACALVTTLLLAPAAASAAEWARDYGSTYSVATDIALRDHARPVVTGSYMGGLDFGGSTQPLSTVPGDINGYVALLDEYGKGIWSRSFGDDQRSQDGNTVAVDTQGDVLLGGAFQSTIDFDGTVHTAAYRSMFLAKLDGGSGKHLWSVSSDASAVGDSTVTGVATDADDNVYAVGTFRYALDVGCTLEGGLHELFVAKFSPEGACLWAQKLTSTGLADATGVAVDAEGDVVVAGNFRGALSFPSGATLAATTAYPGFVVKLSDSGGEVWRRLIENHAGSVADLATDPEGNVIVAGTFRTMLSTGPLTLLTATHGDRDAYAIKLDRTGAVLWGRAVGDTDNQGADGVTAGADGTVTLVGSFSGQLSPFSLAAPPVTLSSYAVQLDRNGQALGGEVGESNFASYAAKVAVSRDNGGGDHVFLTGTYMGKISFGESAMVSEVDNRAYVCHFEGAL